MDMWSKITNEGISIGIGDEMSEHLKPCPLAEQERPKKYYVYGHFDEHGVPFYIGKGTGRRAWKNDRHELWHRYVKNHLNEKYSVVILVDDLTSDQAEHIESLWIAQESETLVNWINYNRETDFEAIEKYHNLRNSNRQLIALAREQEKLNSDEAINLYYKALGNIESYATIQPELGLVGSLLDESLKENGINGEIQILDRLTLCLGRSGRETEAIEVTKQYFTKYRSDHALSAAVRIKKRNEKMIRKLANNGIQLKTSSAVFQITLGVYPNS